MVERLWYPSMINTKSRLDSGKWFLIHRSVYILEWEKVLGVVLFKLISSGIVNISIIACKANKTLGISLKGHFTF